MIVGGAEQNGHDYGWQFGNWQLGDMKELKVIFNIGIQIKKTLITTGNLFMSWIPSCNEYKCNIFGETDPEDLFRHI